MENTNINFNSLLDDIHYKSQLQQVLVSENAPSELRDKLSYYALQKLIGYIKDDSPAERIFWFLELLDEKYAQEGKQDNKREKLNLQDYIESMLDKIGSKQRVWDMAELIGKIANYDLTNYVEKILSKIADNQKAEDMKKIAQSLKKCEKIAQNFSDYVDLILDKLKNKQSGPDFDDMAKLITEFKDCKLEKNHVEKILSKIEDNQKADDMAKLVKSLRECGVKVEEYIGSILDKLADGQPGNHATWNPMAELVQEFKGCKLEKNHVEKILSKIADNQNADDMAKLVKSLRECDVKVEEYIKSILDKCKDKQSAGDMAKLITEFKDCKLEKNHVEKILSKIEDNQNADDMAKLVKSLRECGVKVEEYIGSILGKLADGQFAGGSSWFGSMAKLIKEFKGCKLTDDHVKKILAKTKDKASAGDMTELVKSLRERNVKVEDYIGSISDRLANDQSAGDMTELVKSLKTCGVQVEKYIGSISNKLAGDQSAGDITKLITEFKDCNLSKKDINPIIEKIARKQSANDMLYLAQYLKDQKYDINGIMSYIVNRIKEDAEQNMDLIAELIDLVVNSNNNTEEQYFRASLAKMQDYKSIDKLVALVEKLPNTALGNQAFGDAFNIVLDQILKDRPNYSKLLVGITSLITLLASKNCKNNKFYKSLLDKLAQINPKVEESYSITNLTTIVNKLSSSESFECIEQVFIEKLTSVNLKTLTQEIMGKNKNNFGSYINDAIN
ncbi:MAG: hypothetical protein IJU86_01045, partial [Firmicutes bacterium]|nr:hypothetical protein [Bacillota bacterium]